MKNNINKIITLGMAGAVALSAPLSLIYANDDVIIIDSCDEDHIEYPFIDEDGDGFCDNCGAEKEENTENTENTGTIVDVETSESTETESTETPEEKNLKDFTFFIKGYNTASDEDITNIYNKLKTDGKYKLSYNDNKTEKDLKVKANIYNNDDEIIDSFVLSNSDNIIKNLPDKNEHGYKQFFCDYELVAENLHYTKDNKCFMYSSIKTEDGEIPVLKLFQLTPCINHSNFENPVHIEKEYGVVCDYNNPDFDLDLFLENEEMENFFFPSITSSKDCCCESGVPDLPDLPDIPETSETTETTESTEEPSTETTEIPSTESTEEPSTESTEEPSTESTEEPSTESTEEPSTETTEIPSTESTEEPSTETTEIPSTETTEEPSTETTEEPSTESTEEPSTESTEEPSTESTEEPSTESTEEPSTETTEEPSTETSEESSTETSEIPSTETSEKPSTETTTTPTPEPVKPVNPVEPVKPVEPTPTPITTTTETTTITEDRGKVDPSESKNEMVQTGDMATQTYYGGYFLATGFTVLGAFFKKFKK